MSQKTSITQVSDIKPGSIVDMPFDFFSLPLELREMVYEYLEMPRKANAFLLPHRFGPGLKRAQYHWGEVKDDWMREKWNRNACVECILKTRDGLQDVGLWDCLQKMPRSSPIIHKSVQPWIDFINDLEGRKDSRQTGTRAVELWKQVARAKESLKALKEGQDNLNATAALLCTNRQLSGEVRNVIAKNVHHEVVLNPQSILELDLENYPCLSSLYNVRSANFPYSSGYDEDLLHDPKDRDIVQRIKNIAETFRFMPLLKKVKLDIDYTSHTHVWSEIEKDVKQVLTDTLTERLDQLERMEIEFSGYFGKKSWEMKMVHWRVNLVRR